MDTSNAFVQATKFVLQEMHMKSQCWMGTICSVEVTGANDEKQEAYLEWNLLVDESL